MASDTLKSRLDRLGRLAGGPAQTQSKTAVPELYHELAERLGGQVLANHAGAYCLVTTVYDRSYRHGDMVVDELLSDAPVPLAAFRVEDIPDAAAPAGLLFVDTETTGLGGAGAVAFLVGCGSFTPSGLEVRQYLIPDYSDEAAMLEAVLDELGPSRTLVTYNGAAFDVPLLQDRMIINRVAREITAAGHIDLLQPTRRLFKRRLADCSLINVERALFGFSRRDDLPGYLIPSVYFQWLSERNSDLLVDVLKHNRLDIVSLAFLVKRLADVHRTDGGILDHVDDIHSLSRVYGRRGRLDKASGLFHRINAANPGRLSPDIALYHSLVFKRSGAMEKAVALWLGLADLDSGEGYWANLELSKYYEHRVRNVSMALVHAEQAGRCACLTRSRRRELESRLRRLEAKQARP